MAVKRLARRNYKSMTKAVVSSQHGSKPAIASIAKVMRDEMQRLCSVGHDSILRDNIEAVKCFSWETVWLELKHKLPTLISLLKQLLKQPDDHTPLICFLASAILKQRSPKTCLVQRAISVLLYGNGTSKEVKIMV